MAHLVAASVEVKDVTEEGNGNENDGNLKRKRKVNRKYLDDCYDVDAGDEPKKAKRDEDEMGVDVGLHAEEKPQCKANQQQTRQGIS